MEQVVQVVDQPMLLGVLAQLLLVVLELLVKAIMVADIMHFQAVLVVVVVEQEQLELQTHQSE